MFNKNIIETYVRTIYTDYISNYIIYKYNNKYYKS